MSATAVSKGGPVSWSVFWGAVLAACAVLAPQVTPWIAPDGLAARALSPSGFALGSDATLLVAGALPFTPAVSLWAASWFGAAVLLGVVLLAGARTPVLGAAVGLAACLNPLALNAYSSGWGLAVAGVFVLAAQVTALPDRAPHRGFPLLGAGAAAAAASVPGAGALALPFFAVLFVSAPRPWARGTMRSLYLTVFAMPAAWFGFLCYLGSQTDAPGPGVLPSGAEDVWHFILGGALAAICAPGVLFEAMRKPAGLSLLALSAMAFVTPGLPDPLAVFIAWSAQAAATLRFGGPGRLAALGAASLSSAGAMLLLAS